MMDEQFFIFLEFIRQTVLHLPEVIEKPCYNTPGFYAGKNLFARMQEDGETLSVYTQHKEAWMQRNPTVYFTNDHFRGYAYVLVRLPLAAPDDLRKLLLEGWGQRASKRALQAYERNKELRHLGH